MSPHDAESARIKKLTEQLEIHNPGTYDEDDVKEFLWACQKADIRLEFPTPRFVAEEGLDGRWHVWDNWDHSPTKGRRIAASFYDVGVGDCETFAKEHADRLSQENN